MNGQRPRFWKSLSFFEKKKRQLQFKLLAKSFLHGTWKMYRMHSTATCRCFHLFLEKTQRKENISQHSSAGVFFPSTTSQWLMDGSQREYRWALATTSTPTAPINDVIPEHIVGIILPWRLLEGLIPVLTEVPVFTPATAISLKLRRKNIALTWILSKTFQSTLVFPTM